MRRRGRTRWGGTSAATAAGVSERDVYQHSSWLHAPPPPTSCNEKVDSALCVTPPSTDYLVAGERAVRQPALEMGQHSIGTLTLPYMATYSQATQVK